MMSSPVTVSERGGGTFNATCILGEMYILIEETLLIITSIKLLFFIGDIYNT